MGRIATELLMPVITQNTVYWLLETQFVFLHYKAAQIALCGAFWEP